jgi:hypothetical protein
MDGDQPQVVDKDGERGRNQTFSLLIKSYGSRFGCGIINCSRHNNLTIKRPAWTASENVGKVGEIETRLTIKDTKKTQLLRVNPSVETVWYWHTRRSIVFPSQTFCSPSG